MKKRDSIILLHGIGMASWNMWPIAHSLKHKYKNIYNITYPSTAYSLADLTEWLDAKIKEYNINFRTQRVDFVGHSMGGILISFYQLHFLNIIPSAQKGRNVFLGTPFGGSEIADHLKNNCLYKMFFGPAGQELTTEFDYKKTLSLSHETAVIAGNRNWCYPLGKMWIKKPNDGCVSVDSTYHPDLKDHMVYPITHGFMPWNKNIRCYIWNFLQDGILRGKI